MPQLAIKKESDVPRPSRTSQAVQKIQQTYEEFVQSIGSDVGELTLAPDDQVRGVKVRLRRASTRISTPIEIWEADGKVYFKAESKVRRGRPRKNRVE